MRTLVAIALALTLAACAPEAVGGGGNGGAPPAPVGELWNTSWVAESIAEKPVDPPGAITLVFGQGQAGGSGGCNRYSGGVTATGGAIKFANLASTMMACLQPGKMEQESAYHEVLRDAVRYERPGAGRLDIVAADGRRLVFVSKP
jgi:heat shock protein HslJ